MHVNFCLLLVSDGSKTSNGALLCTIHCQILKSSLTVGRSSAEEVLLCRKEFSLCSLALPSIKEHTIIADRESEGQTLQLDKPASAMSGTTAGANSIAWRLQACRPCSGRSVVSAKHVR